MLSTTICPALDDAVFISAPAAVLAAGEEDAADGGAEVLVPELPPHPASAAATINAPNPKPTLFFMSSSLRRAGREGRR
ncbi:hypothetical protein CVCC1112_2232 [Paenarthrobacter nicotinovorans]|nr:hypothetical protein CVCC1112_2232 [Paenarthrobacter nicotinovorans]